MNSLTTQLTLTTAHCLDNIMRYDSLNNSADGENTLENKQAMNQFLAGVERRAFRIAEIATSSSEDALDLVQDAMMKLVQKYAHKPEAEWGPLFHRILQSKINDWYRRTAVRNKFRSWFHLNHEEDDANTDPIQAAPDHQGKDPERMTANEDAGVALDAALKNLPLRQQQAFLLRNWEGMSVIETAKAMGCSEGSVKTHYSRAVHSLRTTLEDHWP